MGGENHIATSGPKFQFSAAIFPFKFSNKGGIIFPVKHPRDARLDGIADFEILPGKAPETVLEHLGQSQEKSQIAEPQ